MSNVTLQALFERDYKEAGIEIPLWTPEQLHIFDGAEYAFEIGCELAWKEEHPVSSWPTPDETSVDPRDFGFSSEEMLRCAWCMVFEAGIPLPDTTI
jgi:hypothetical protein